MSKTIQSLNKEKMRVEYKGKMQKQTRVNHTG